jgi:hypothetical protein
MDKPGQAQAQIPDDDAQGRCRPTPLLRRHSMRLKSELWKIVTFYPRIDSDCHVTSHHGYSIPSGSSSKKILVTGGAGFVGSHLVDKLMMEGHEVIVVDNFFTGQKKNVAHWLHHPEL